MMSAVQVAGLTEITSNVATANILLPVLAEVSSDGLVLTCPAILHFYIVAKSWGFAVFCCLIVLEKS